MVDKIVNLADYQHDPHISGEAACLTCGHRWAAAAPTGTVWLECPECNSMKGHYLHPCITNADHEHCNCGNHLFAMDVNGLYCPHCGTRHTF